MPAYAMGKMGNCPGPSAQEGPGQLPSALHLLKGLLKIKEIEWKEKETKKKEKGQKRGKKGKKEIK